MRSLVLALCASLVALPAAARSGRQEVVPAEERILPWEASIPGCQAPNVLEKISSMFAEKEAKFWNSTLTITQYENIQRIAWRPWGLDTIPRRYCTATAWTSDGVRRKIDYSVREDLGIIGASWGVEYCVKGLDRSWAFAPGCRMARP
jgi:hypothetical protein